MVESVRDSRSDDGRSMGAVASVLVNVLHAGTSSCQVRSHPARPQPNSPAPRNKLGSPRPPLIPPRSSCDPPRKAMAKPSLRALAAAASAAAARLAAASSSSSSASAAAARLAAASSSSSSASAAVASPGVASAMAYFPGVYSSELLLLALRASISSAARRAVLDQIARGGPIISFEGLVGDYQMAVEAALEEEELRFPCASAACESGSASSTAPRLYAPSSSRLFAIYAADWVRSAPGPTSAAAATQGARAFAPLTRSSPAPTSTAGQAAASMSSFVTLTAPSLARGYATNHDEDVDELIRRMTSIQLNSDDELRFRIAFHKKFFPYWTAILVSEYLQYQTYSFEECVHILKVIYPKLGPQKEAVHVLLKEDMDCNEANEGSDPALNLALAKLDVLIKKQAAQDKVLLAMKEAAERKTDFSKAITYLGAIARFFGF
ncbi:hypothetical protein EJB05_25886 [Eragrostis curvula]|uniref:Uncharacterized protein n=1 Tax=Eragrostis curvula TaxID=38414 RepID=A0A5J9UIH4_9POAL|nr:hypothetical protein EJB05_25886 [Eragrostis curvula]